MQRRSLVAVLLASSFATLAGCQSSQPQSRDTHAAGDGLSDTESANMAAEDANNLNLEKSSTQPGRRPPPPRERRAVDQPRVRG